MIDYTIDDVIFLPFTTRAFATGIPTVLAGSPTLEIYEDAGVSPIVEGVGKLVLTISLNSVVGFNIATVTLSAANGFEEGKHYTLIIKTGTVAAVSVVGEVVGEFTILFSAAAVDLANVTDGLGAIKAETALILTDTGTTLDNHLTDIKGTGFAKDTHSLIDIESFVDILDDGTSGNAKIATDAAATLLDTANMQPKLGTISDLGSGATIGDNLFDTAGAVGDTLSKVTTIEVDTTNIQAQLVGVEGATLMVFTTIATLASQTSFTLTAGSADNDAYNNCTIVIEDAATATQKAVGLISDYIGSSKTITLKYDPAIFTMATTDKVYILAENALKATLANRQLNVAADGDIAGNVDGSVGSLGATAKTDVNTEVDNALDTALPASPTTGSINDILDRQEELLVNGSAVTGTLSTTEMTTDLTITVADQYNGRLLTFRKDTTTAALRGQQTDITATTVLNGKLGFTALTTAPANGDLFDIT